MEAYTKNQQNLGNITLYPILSPTFSPLSTDILSATKQKSVVYSLEWGDEQINK